MSIDRFAQAQAALQAGDVEEAIALTEAELTADPKAPVAVYRNFATLLFRRQMYAQAERWAQAGVELYSRDFDLWNLLGVACRRQEKFEAALKALAQAEKINPKNTSALSNKGNIFNDMKNGPAAVDVFTKLVRIQPSSAEFQRALGVAFRHSGDLAKASIRFNLATKLKPDFQDAWLDLTAVTAELNGPVDTISVFDRAIAAMPSSVRLKEAKALALRRSNRLRETEAYLAELLTEFGDLAWIHYQIGGVISDYDRLRANIHFEKAIELDPSKFDYRMALSESLGRSRHGDESENLERAYQVLNEGLELQGMSERLAAGPLKVALEIIVRLADYDRADTLGTFSEVGDSWIDAGKHTAMLSHLARVKTPENRHELVEMHRRWGRKVLDTVKKWPLSYPAPRAPNGKIRLGFMSSDLRGHPVAYFAMPLFEHYDRSRFEIYCYSYYEGATADALQAKITELVDTFRWEKDANDHSAAQLIANDQLDMLIELGGSTHMNKLNVMAFKPAPLQASWLGYPHSAGLENIDHLILDPYVAPSDRSLVIEEPLLMPKSWIAMGERAFPERPITEGTPEERNGFLTFGTANNPYKYSREMVKAWARVTAAVPGARFIFVRPEGGAPSFRKNILALFAAEGVPEDRVRFEDIRGAHMPFYNDIDISLDTFPQTGGTTTCEALWMGVPVVTLVGEAMFERLSYSILTNAGLGDLCARDEDEYLKAALTLAGDPERRKMLRTGLRGMLKASPLGQTKQFAVDFYEMIEGAVARAKAAGKIPVAA
jgi:predicted O-linked N-acetylglucosamine transferase (SPINDLY family)